MGYQRGSTYVGRMRADGLALWFTTLALAACAVPPPLAPESGPPVASAAEPSPAEAPDPTPPSRDEPGRFVDLPVPGHTPALLWVPSGRQRRPLLVVAHGAGGRAEFHCDLWEQITRDRAFVLCPRGARISSGGDGYFYRNDRALEAEVVAAVQALREEHARVDPGPAIYVGYSQGAMMGAFMAHRRPALFPRLVLIEGGRDWNMPIAQAWHDGGGERVLFVCGRQVCRDDAARVRTWLEGAGAVVRIEYAPGAGHTPAGEVAERARAAFDWVIEGDARW